MADTLATLIRKKFPGEYDDLDDISLEKAVLAKYPEYEDIPRTEAPKQVETFPIPAQTPIEDTPVEEAPQEKGWLSKAWSAVSEPLTDLPSRFADTVADYIDAPSLERSPTMARVAGFGAGALQGLGDVVSGLTSPINLATAAMSGGSSLAGKAGLNTIAEGLKQGAKIPAAMTAIHGGSEVVNPESTMTERAMGLTEVAGGLAGMKGPMLEEGPIIKPQVETPITPEVQTPKYKMGTIAVIKSTKATPELVKKARAEGFEFEGINDQGDFRFKKTSEPGQLETPVLESEVGNERAKLGPSTDVKKSNTAAEAFNLPRAVMASMDFSAPLRQGLPLIHRKEFWKALGPMFKSWGSEDAFRASQQSIAERPLFKPRVGKDNAILPSFAEDAGLKLTDLTDLSKREEALMSTWAEKIPGVRPSNRAYTTFLNKLRADTFESLISDGKVLGLDGKTNVPLARNIADFVNTASGRGSLGKLESSAVALNSTFFSPRLIASRLKMLDPRLYTTSDPLIRKEALKSLFSVAAVGNTLGQLAKMSGHGTVESDPTSSDFGKIKIGNTRIDPFAGFQQYIVAANRLIQGRTKSSTTGQEYNLGEKFGRPTRLDVAGRFAESKLNPVLSFATGLLRGKDFTGQPFNIPEEVASRFIPIFIQDLKSLATENPNLIPGLDPKAFDEFHPENLPFAIPSMFGMGVQQY